MKRIPRGALFFAGLVMAGMTGWVPASFAGDIVAAEVNGKPIMLSEIEETLKAIPENARAEILSPDNRRNVVERYVMARLLLEEAKRRKIDESPDFAKRVEAAQKDILISMLLEKLEADIVVSEKDVRDYYDTHKAEFQTPETRRARHVLVTDEKRAREILKRVESGGKLESEARLHSEEKVSAAEGGDIGWHERGEIIPEFAKAIFSMKQGELLNKPLRTRRGWHIIRLEGIRPAKEADFRDIQDKVRQRVIQERRRNLIPDLAKRLKEKANVQIHDEALKSLGATSKAAK